MHLASILMLLISVSAFRAANVHQNCTDEISQLQRKVSKLNKLVSLTKFKPTVPTTNCTLTHFEFPRQLQKEDFVWYRMHFPRLTRATMCAWLRATDLSHQNYYLSYATNAHSNQLLISLRKPSTLEVYMQSYVVNLEMPDPGKLNHVCVWIDSKRAVIGAFVNGEEIPSQGYPGYVVQGGGSLILGQDQDAVNAGNLDPNQCFSGTIDNFMIWPRVLSHVEVLRIGALGQCPIDHAVVMTTDRVEMWGESLYSVPTESPLMDV